MKPSEIKALGVFGGAFDPPHWAHVALVKAAMAQLALDRVLVLPTGQAWHKTRSLSQASHRLNMTRLAFAPLPQVVVDAREIERAGPSYTVDTLHELQQEFPQSQLYLLLGDDQRRSLSSWHRIEEIGRIAIICAAGRDEAVLAWNQPLPAPQPTPPLSDALQARILTLQMPPMPHSATELRERVYKNQAISALLPPAVERYIHEHHLYRPHK